MFNKIARVLRHGNVSTGFEAYLNNINRIGKSEGPTRDEARRDYSYMSRQRFVNMV